MAGDRNPAVYGVIRTLIIIVRPEDVNLRIDPERNP